MLFLVVLFISLYFLEIFIQRYGAHITPDPVLFYAISFPKMRLVNIIIPISK